MGNRARSLWLAVVTSGVAVVSISPAGAAPMFMGLGTLPGGEASFAFGVSADGSVVVGYSRTQQPVYEAFRWTVGGGMVGLGDLPGGLVYSYASGVSGDGSVVAGTSISANGTVTPTLNGTEAFRWTAGGGMIGLGDLPGGIFDSSARGISADGSVVVGVSDSALGTEAFRWTSGSGMIGLGFLPGGNVSSVATSASADGSVVVGVSDSTSGTEAFRWTSGGGMVGLGDLPGGIFHSVATGVSADGSVIVGDSISGVDKEVFRWTLGGGMIGLGDLPGGVFASVATGVSADGSVIVGKGNSASGTEPFLWDEANGMRSLTTVLVDLGLDLTGWTLENPWAISADGLTIVGFGENPNHETEAWIAVIPEPSTALLVMTGLLGLAYRQRRRSASKNSHGGRAI